MFGITGPQPANAPLASVSGRLVTVAEAAAAIRQGRVLWIGGDEALLRQLPTGHWIGGTIPYFVAQDGGETTRERVFCSELPPNIAPASTSGSTIWTPSAGLPWRPPRTASPSC